MQAPREQLGSFYLGGIYDLDAEANDMPLLYDARDLTTHAICVGMTGSGKTGLCIGLLEEAALDKVPALVVDPKGDITNLLLQFPELKPEDFSPWVNADDARRKGQSIEEYAAQTADLWKSGLSQWGIDGSRIRHLGESSDFTIYTPGSDAGVGVDILGSLAAPDVDFDSDAEMLRERISGTVAALLGLIDLKADPVRSREGVLLAHIFEHYWRTAEDLDLQKMILAIQNPPVKQLGVFDVDTFFPPKDRDELAMAFNSLVASPTFAEWLQGVPLDIDQLLYTEEGQPRHGIFYLAHLSDTERMFFVTLLLESLITWMRRQSGTTSLRSLLYFDEVFGFFPPTAEPPSKRPLLTIMKQARAFGVGAVLVTQNPVDIDYKGLSNAGTWFIGKLQTERDKDRVLAALEGAIADAGGEARTTDFDALINRLDSRVFLMHNVHEDAPLVFHTRWAMSYLRGPLTRPQVRTLMEEAGKRDHGDAQTEPDASSSHDEAIGQETAEGVSVEGGIGEVPAGYSRTPPGLDPDLTQFYLPATVSSSRALRQVQGQQATELSPVSVTLTYRPGLLGIATVHFLDRKRDLETERDVKLWLEVAGGTTVIDWEGAVSVNQEGQDLLGAAETPATGDGPYFGSVPELMDSARDLKSAHKEFADWLYYNSRYPLTVQADLGLYQEPGESDRDFAIRLRQAAREARDAEVDALEAKYADRIERVEEKIDAAARKLSGLEAEYSARRQHELIGLGESALSYLLGRRSSRTFSGFSSRRRMTVKAHHTLEAAREKLEDLEADIVDLRDELDAEADDITVKWAAGVDRVETIELKPRRTDVDVQLVALGWMPYWLVEYDGATPSKELIAANEAILSGRQVANA